MINDSVRLRVLNWDCPMTPTAPHPYRTPVPTSQNVTVDQTCYNGCCPSFLPRTVIFVIFIFFIPYFIDLPSDPNMAEFKDVWTRLKSQNQYHLEPISLLVSLVATPNEAEDLSRRWKLSNSERLLGVFIAKHRTITYKETTPLKYFQDLLIDKALKEHVIEVLRYCGRRDDADYITKWKIPVLPVAGNDLIQAGVPTGPQMGRTLKFVKEKWKDSFYSLSKEELLEMALKKH